MAVPTRERDISATYPIQLVLTGRPCLVVGGGTVAERKVAGLRRAGADVTVVAPRIAQSLVDADDVTCHHRPYRPGEVAGYALAITTTDDPDLNARVAADGAEAGVWVNSADDPANCDFILPAVARNGPLQVTVSTSGRSPALAAWLRRRYQDEIDHDYVELLDLLFETREEVRSAFGTTEQTGWSDALDGEVIDLLRTGRREAARQQLRTLVGLAP